MTDPRLIWINVFDDSELTIRAANHMDGVLLKFDNDQSTVQFLPGYRVRKQEGDMDSAGLERRE